jgi:hypothetical protein
VAAVEPSRGAVRFWAIASLAFAGVLAWLGATDQGVPERAALEMASGRVDWVSQDDYGVEFAFVGDERLFDYAAKGDGAAQVHDALEGPAGREVTVLYGRDTHGPLGSDRRLHSVFDVVVDGRQVRAYEQVRAGWAADFAFLPWLVAAFVCNAGMLWVLSYRCPP